MFVAQWVSVVDGEMVPHCKAFGPQQMSDTLKFLEELRAKRREGEPLSFITMTSELSDSVGESGAATIAVDMRLPDGSIYAWRKRR